MKRSRLSGLGKSACPQFRLKHGADPDSMYDPKYLAIGQKIEMEHTDDPVLAKKISKAHLSERSDYYLVLKEVGL
jgi:hypothetical protein